VTEKVLTGCLNSFKVNMAANGAEELGVNNAIDVNKISGCQISAYVSFSVKS
jgi:hypothetical protein